jgi:Xaa-Pro dipeptidase
MIPYEPAFPVEEYQTRLEHVKRNMAERQIDALLLVSPQNVYYLSGMDSEVVGHLRQSLIVPLKDDPTLVVWDFHSAAADNTCWLDKRVTYSSFEDPIEVILATIRQLGLQRKRLGLSQRSRWLTPYAYQRLVAGLPDAEVQNPFGVVENIRLRKSAAELVYIRQAAELTDQAVESAYNAMVVSAHDNDVAAAIMETLYSAGKESISHPPIVASGYRAGIAHSSFNGRTLAQGDTIFLEFTGRVRRYVAPVMRTAILGQPTPEMERIAEVGAQAVDTLIEEARAGVSARDVAKAGLAVIEPVLRDFDLVFHHDFGYPVGIHYPQTWHENLDFMIRVENAKPLEAGMVFHLPMSLRKHGEFGINQSHTVVITETGAEALTATPARLQVLGD